MVLSPMSDLSFSWRFALVGLRFSLADEVCRSTLCVAVFGVHRGVGPGGGLLGMGSLEVGPSAVRIWS